MHRFILRLDESLERLGADIFCKAMRLMVIISSFTSMILNYAYIHAACFEDRVLHHAMMNLAEPVFEQALVYSTYACRPNKGVHKAVAQVQQNLQRFPWFVKVDVKRYFPSIDHNRLFELLGRRFKGQAFLQLLEHSLVCAHVLRYGAQSALK